MLSICMHKRIFIAIFIVACTIRVCLCWMIDPPPAQVVNVGNCLRLEQVTAPHCRWRTLAAFNNRGTAVKLMQLERVAMAGAHEL